jgi:hypothetical protein
MTVVVWDIILLLELLVVDCRLNLVVEKADEPRKRS